MTASQQRIAALVVATLVIGGSAIGFFVRDDEEIVTLPTTTATQAWMRPR